MNLKCEWAVMTNCQENKKRYRIQSSPQTVLIKENKYRNSETVSLIDPDQTIKTTIETEFKHRIRGVLFRTSQFETFQSCQNYGRRMIQIKTLNQQTPLNIQIKATWSWKTCLRCV